MSDDRRQKFIDDGPLVVPSELAGCRGKDLALRYAPSPRLIDEHIVGLQHSEVHLRHQHVRIVARITNEGDAFRVARYVHAIDAQQELRWIVAPEQERMTHGSISVETFEIEKRRACVPKRPDVDVASEHRTISGDVVGNELPEDRPSGGLRPERIRRIGGVAAVAGATHPPDRVKKRFVGLERGKIGKHSRVPARTDRGINRRA